MKRQGFTLIELLVVIAIIGILAGVVLASVSTARSKGKDATIQQQITSMRNAGEIYYSSHSNGFGAAGTNCGTTAMFADTVTNFAGLINAVNLASKVSADYDRMVCNNSGTAWAVSARLPSASTYWCADSMGVSKGEPSQLGSSAYSCT